MRPSGKAPDQAAEAFNADNPYWFKVTREIGVLMRTGTRAEVYVYLAIAESVQNDRNPGKLAGSELAKRTGISRQASIDAADELCRRGIVCRINPATGAKLTKPEQWNGRTVTYALPHDSKQRDTGNLTNTGDRLRKTAPDPPAEAAQFSELCAQQARGVRTESALPADLPTVVDGNLTSTVVRNLTSTVVRTSDPSDPSDPKRMNGGGSALPFSKGAEKADGHPASAKTAEDVAAVALAASAPKNGKKTADEAEDWDPLEVQEAIDAELSAFDPAPTDEFDRTELQPWVIDAVIGAGRASGATPAQTLAWLKRKRLAGWQPRLWKEIPAVIRDAFASRPPPAGRPWTPDELGRVQRCGADYMGCAPPPDFARNCELAADGTQLQAILTLLKIKHANVRYRPGCEAGPDSWNWFYTVIRNRFGRGTAGLPETPAARSYVTSPDEVICNDVLELPDAPEPLKCPAPRAVPKTVQKVSNVYSRNGRLRR
jgi:hypothetical protein